MRIVNFHVTNIINRFPFAWKNPYGFVIAFTAEFIVATYVFNIAICLLTFSFVFVLLAYATTKVIKQSLYAINGIAQSPNDQTSIPNQISQFIRYHSLLKQLSKNSMLISCIFVESSRKIMNIFFQNCHR